MTKGELLEAMKHWPDDWEIHDESGEVLDSVHAYSRDKVIALYFRGEGR